MENLITTFMNYKINRLVEYGIFLCQKDNKFIRQVFEAYFRTYVDNRYYGIFNTIDDGPFNEKNLKLEFNGIMEEMLIDYKAFELKVSNSEYSNNQSVIRHLNSIAYEIRKIDALEYKDKDNILAVLGDFVEHSKILSGLVGNRLIKFVSLVKETYNVCTKMLEYEDSYYVLEDRKFEEHTDKVFIDMVPSIKVLEVYPKSMIYKVYQDNRLNQRKVECFIQKISLFLLKKILSDSEINTYFVEFPDGIVHRGKIKESILSVMDNPVFRKYVVIGIHYNTYLAHKEAFSEDYQFACIQDFTYINDIYQKVDAIYKEGVFNYLIVSGCRYREREFFLTYKNDTMSALLFEEE